jgi:hypothetical protein
MGNAFAAGALLQRKAFAKAPVRRPFTQAIF